MRPIYESSTDRANERRVAGIIESKWQVELIKLDKRQHCDFLMVEDGWGIGWIELKVRPKYTWDQLSRLGGYMISLDKLANCCVKAKITKSPFHLAVECSGDLRFATLAAPGTTVFFDRFKIGGRKDRGDNMDTEVCAFIPVRAFVKIK